MTTVFVVCATCAILGPAQAVSGILGKSIELLASVEEIVADARQALRPAGRNGAADPGAAAALEVADGAAVEAILAQSAAGGAPLPELPEQASASLSSDPSTYPGNSGYVNGRTRGGSAGNGGGGGGGMGGGPTAGSAGGSAALEGDLDEHDEPLDTAGIESQGGGETSAPARSTEVADSSSSGQDNSNGVVPAINASDRADVPTDAASVPFQDPPPFQSGAGPQAFVDPPGFAGLPDLSGLPDVVGPNGNLPAGPSGGRAAQRSSDSAGVAQVPEPATLVLVGLGLGGVAHWRRRRRSAVPMDERPRS